VESNVIDTFEVGVMQWRTASDIRNNVIYASFDGWGAGIEHNSGNAVVESNVITVSRGISDALFLNDCREIRVRNNIFMGVQNHYGLLVDVNSHHDSCRYGTTVGEITNNLFYGGRHGLAVYSCAYPVVRGNIFAKCDWWDMLLVADDPTRVGYNLYWDTHGPNPPLDSARRRDRQSIFADPMFVDSLDFHLQAFSPAIDAGDTLLFDPDGTRSDIGPYGGPLGESYAYVDLPPRSPTDLTGEVLSQNRVRLYWHRNHESDLHHYEVYWSREAFVHPDSGGGAILVRSVAGDTSCIHTADLNDHPYCSWAVRAVDAQGGAGSFSEPFALAVAGIGDEDATLPGSFTLHPNYPNPFNAQTRITYSLAAPAEVTLAIYDVLGRYVRTLVRGAQPAGEHSVQWDGTDDGAREVASGVYLLRLSVGDEAQTRKVLLLK
jgi:hypothetical protein